MFGYGKNENSKNLPRPAATAVPDAGVAPQKTVPKVQIDMTPNSIVNVMSGDPFKKSFDRRTSARQLSVEKVRQDF